MNITRYKNFDDLIEKKDVYIAQEITNDQLKLISKGYIPTKFNVGINDVLEFTLYDASNNVLPQEPYGNVRYIKGDKIKDYLLVSNNPYDQVNEGGGFVIDAKKLVKEAGYNTGYFRVQINFVNNRVGSEYSKDRMWIQEISSTRYEMRLLPFNNFDETNTIDLDIKKDLNQSYDSFLLGKFSGDEVYQEIYTILDSLKASDIANMMKTIMTQQTINKLAQEFNIVGGYDLFYARVLDDMKKAVVNELLYRNSIIGSDDFGKLISDTTRNKISQKDFNYYTKADIVFLLNSKFRESIKYHLPKRTLNETLRVNEKTQESLDKLNEVVQTLTSNSTYQIPQVEKTILTPPVTNIPSPSEKVYQEEVKSGANNTEVIVSDRTPPPLLIPDTQPVILDPIIFTAGPTVSDITNVSAKITFSTNIGAPAKIIFSSPCPAGGCEFGLIRGASTHYYNITGLNPNTTYSFTVVSTLSDGRSSRSNSVSFDTLASLINENIDKFDPYLSNNTTTTPYTPPADYSGGGSNIIDSSVLITSNTSISGGTLTTGATRNRRTQ